MPHDAMANESDAAIQDMLNELGTQPPQIQQQPLPQQMMQQQMPPMPMPLQMQMQPMDFGMMPPMQAIPEPMTVSNDIGSMAGPSQFQNGLLPANSASETTMQSKYASLLSHWNNDMKIVLLAVGIYIIVSIVPLETYVYKYIAIDKIPYSAVLIKAILAGIALIVLMKIV